MVVDEWGSLVSRALRGIFKTVEMMQKKRRFKFLAAMTLVLVVTSGCATTSRISQFDTFATAGNQYATAMDGLLTESTNVMVDANSRKIMWTAAPLVEAASTPEEQDQVKTMLVDQLQVQDDVMRLNIKEIELLRAQVKILSTYFGRLAALATTDAPAQFGAQLENSVTALNSLSNELNGSSLINQPEAVQQLAGGLGSLVVKGVQQRALENELEARKTTIAETLRLHQALLAAIKAQIDADAGIIRQREYEVRVRDAIVTSVNRQETWIRDRRSLLEPVPVSQQVSATMSALENMQTAWARLLTSELTAADVQSVVNDLQPVLTGLAALRAD